MTTDSFSFRAFGVGLLITVAICAGVLGIMFAVLKFGEWVDPSCFDGTEYPMVSCFFVGGMTLLLMIFSAFLGYATCLSIEKIGKDAINQWKANKK